MTIMQILWIGESDEVVAAEYDEVNLDVAVFGPDLTYQWQYKSPTGTKWANTTLTGCKTNMLTIYCIHPGHDGYSLRCVITNGNGDTFIASAVLHVLM